MSSARRRRSAITGFLLAFLAAGCTAGVGSTPGVTAPASSAPTVASAPVLSASAPTVASAPVSSASAPTVASAPVLSASAPTVASAPVLSVPPGSSAPASHPGSGSSDLVVTIADDGSTLQLATGERFLLKLGQELEWTVSIADPSVVSRVLGIAVIVGAQGVYEAKAPGTTTLTATGDPACRRATPACAAPSRLFTLTLKVR